MAEVMPMQIRGTGNAFATGVGNWAVSTLWAQVSPIALGSIGWKFNFVFAAFSTFRSNVVWMCLTRDCSRSAGHLPHHLLPLCRNEAKVS
jgi:hypothetical protein